MKTIKVIYVIISAILIFSSNINAQENPVIGKFSITHINQKVFVSITINSGSTCNGIDILRSSDSINFIEIGHIGGVCGSSSEPVNYSFIDDRPIENIKSFYKLKLGGQGLSTILSIEIINLKDIGFQVRPLPANEIVKIYFDNIYNENYELILYNDLGKLVHTFMSKTNWFEIDLLSYKSGFYFFEIHKESSQSYTIGKLIIKH